MRTSQSSWCIRNECFFETMWWLSQNWIWWHENCYRVQNRQVSSQLRITARQYGEVVLPDAASGQGPGTLARKLSRCKEGMAHFLPSRYKILWTLRVSRYKFDRSRKTVTVQDICCGHWRSVAVQSWSKPENCQGILDFNWVQMRVSGCMNHYKFVLRAEAKQKPWQAY